jgi:hypothetical protein
MSNGEPGAAVDAQGRAVLDPTKNVLDLVQAAIDRLDDLNTAYREHYDMRFELLEKQMDRETAHSAELRKAEAERINAIRSVDVAAVQQAAAVSATAATTLAAQVATSAETLRNQVAATQTANAAGLSAALDPIIKDIADLRRAQYEQQGQKAQVTEARSAADPKRQWVSIAIAAAAVVSAFVLTTGGIIITLLLRHPPG